MVLLLSMCLKRILYYICDVTVNQTWVNSIQELEYNFFLIGIGIEIC